MDAREPKRFTSKVEITPVNPFEAIDANAKSTSNEMSSADHKPGAAASPTPSAASNVRQIPVTTDQTPRFGHEPHQALPHHFHHPLGESPPPPPPRAASPFTNHRTAYNNGVGYQSPQMNRKQPQVRIIPISVEGRREPVMPKNVDVAFEPPLHQQKSYSSESAAPPPPKRQSDVLDGGFGAAAPSPFDQQPTPGAAATATVSHEREIPIQIVTSAAVGAPAGASAPIPAAAPKPPVAPSPPPPPAAPPSADAAPPAPPPPPPPKPTPLQLVQEVQKEVDDLTRRVEQFGGATRIHKDYLYLDEMLTRNLIKLDDIDVAGNEELRAARKNVIKCIQQSIALLESKVPVSQDNERASMDQENEGVASSQEAAAAASSNATVDLAAASGAATDAAAPMETDENAAKTN